MKQKLQRLLAILAVFLGSTIVTSLLLNTTSTDDRQTMNSPSMAEVMVDFGGNLCNLMYGYAQTMQTDFIRDCVTPLDMTRQLTLVVLPYDRKVYSLAYEVRSSDGSRVIENRKIKNLEPDDIYLRTTIELSSDLRLGQEYSMQLALETDKGNAYYYTRVVVRTNLNIGGYIQFVRTFVDKSLDKQNAEDLATYLESIATMDTVDYANIDITSTIGQVSWGSLGAQMYRRSVPLIKDINETTASISMEYQIMAVDDHQEQQVFDVVEFYRLRFDESKVRLLDFDRTARQVFLPGEESVTAEGLLLGVRDRNVNYDVSPLGRVIAFVQEGDLWTFCPDDGKATRIFTFRMPEGGDRRDARCRHDIDIIRTTDEGDVDFVLYGYMNRGEREGYSGLCVYHFSSDLNVVEEKVFLPSRESYEFLARDMEKLSYVSTDGYLYLFQAGKLYQVGIEAGSYRVIEEGIDADEFAVSQTHAHAAWRLMEGENAGCIREIDFDSLGRRLVTPGDGRLLRLLGFMNEDVIYGILRVEDLLLDAAGHQLEGLRQVSFENFNGEAVKKYSPPEGEFVTGFTLNPMLLELELSEKKDGAYVSQKRDTILNNAKTPASLVSVEMTAMERYGIVVRLAFPGTALAEKPLIVYARTRSANDRAIVLDQQETPEDGFYVFARGGLDSIWNDPAKAIVRADQQVGVVLNSLQQYVWERGNRKETAMLGLEDIPECMRTTVFDLEAMRESLSRQGQVLDLTGCTLDQILYEISAQRPVFAMTGPGTGVAIMGYDLYNTWLLNVETGEAYAYAMDDSEELFGKAGNVFITCVDEIVF